MKYRISNTPKDLATFLSALGGEQEQPGTWLIDVHPARTQYWQEQYPEITVTPTAPEPPTPPVPTDVMTNLIAMTTAYRQEQTRVFNKYIQPILNRNNADELVALYQWATSQRVALPEPNPDEPNHVEMYQLLPDARFATAALLQHYHPAAYTAMWT